MAWFAHLDGRCQQLRVQWRLSFPQWTNLSPWKVHLHNKIDGDSSEISRTSASKRSSFGPGTPRCIHHALWWRNLARAHAQIVHVLIVLLSLLCTCLLPLFCLSTQTYSLAALNATVTCMHVSSCQQSCMVIHSVCTSPLQLHRGISTLVLLILFEVSWACW